MKLDYKILTWPVELYEPAEQGIDALDGVGHSNPAGHNLQDDDPGAPSVCSPVI